MRWREILYYSKSPIPTLWYRQQTQTLRQLVLCLEYKIALWPPTSTAVYMKVNDSLRGFILHSELFLFAEKMASSWYWMFFYLTWPLSTYTSLFLFCIIILSGIDLPHPSTGIAPQQWRMSYSLSLQRKKNKQRRNKALVLWWLAASVRKGEQPLQ